MTKPPALRPSSWLLAAAAARLRPTGADWAAAMVAEADICTSEFDRLKWAWGCWLAALRLSMCAATLGYAAALIAGLGVMATYEWSADESLATVIVIGLIALVLGALRPFRALLSGILVGLVVTGVTGFEAVSGIRPGYETRTQTVFHSLIWLALLVPAVCSAVMGARIGRMFRSVLPLR